MVCQPSADAPCRKSFSVRGVGCRSQRVHDCHKFVLVRGLTVAKVMFGLIVWVEGSGLHMNQ